MDLMNWWASVRKKYMQWEQKLHTGQNAPSIIVYFSSIEVIDQCEMGLEFDGINMVK